MRQPAFDKAQWAFYGTDIVEDYFVCEGSVLVTLEEPSAIEYTVAVTVPVEFVKFLNDIGHDERVRLYLDQEGTRWVFGYQRFVDDDNADLWLVDLWHYGESNFPRWADRTRAISGDKP